MSSRVPPIGFIADDITGATDLASALEGRGIDTRLAFGAAEIPADGGDAIVVALKIRSVPPQDARAAVEAAAAALTAAGAEQLFSKYCSTFDSTDDGNIGPIADALADATGARGVVHCPAYPENGRTVYLGHLFVGDQLLSESPLRDHPLNPMHDPCLPRILRRQTARPVSLVPFSVVDAGADGVAARLADISAQNAGAHHVIVDAVREADLDTIAAATAADRLACGAAAYGAAFAVAARARCGHRPSSAGRRARVPEGPAAILAGSLSSATREQLRRFDGAVLSLRVRELVESDAGVRRALEFADRRLVDGPLLIATDHETVADRARAIGLSPAEVSRRIELTMGQIAIGLERLGVRRIIVAGGETSGAVADALALRSARIGPDISVGVPWIVADDRALGVVFKSGNFGAPSFFREALEVADR